MVLDNDLEWKTLPELMAAVRAFLDPIPGGVKTARWSPPL